MSRQLFCPHCGKLMDTYTQVIHVKSRQHAVDFGTCRTAGCVLEGMTLSEQTWLAMLIDTELQKRYGLDRVDFDPQTGGEL